MNKSNKKILVVSEINYSKNRLDKWISSQATEFSRSFVASLIDKKNITVNGLIEKNSYIIQMNDIVEINLPEAQNINLLPANLPLDIQFEDNDLVVINKPSGLVVHPAAGHEQDTLVNILLYHIKNLSMKNEKRPGIVHRIDKETSGLLVVAKNDFSHEKLAQQFKNKTTHRVYYAILSGVLKKDKGTIQSYLTRHPNDRKKYCSLRENNKIINVYSGEKEHSKWAVTHYEVVQRIGSMTLVKLKLETGRTHQIRIHMSEIGHVIVGDLTYGYLQQQYKIKKLNRFFLHAAELGFEHPRTLLRMNFTVPWPISDEQSIKSWGFNV